MKRLQKLFSGKLTAYQIATATDLDIDTVNNLLLENITLDDIDEDSIKKLTDLETSLFSNDVDKKDETSA